MGWKVRKARNAFERELIRNGIPKEDAKRLSRHIEVLKNEVMRSFWRFASE